MKKVRLQQISKSDSRLQLQQISKSDSRLRLLSPKKSDSTDSAALLNTNFGCIPNARASSLNLDSSLQKSGTLELSGKSPAESDQPTPTPVK